MYLRLSFFLASLSIIYSSFANNSIYISLSNQKVKMEEINIISNNAANTNTVGYEQDGVVTQKYDIKSGRKINSFSSLKQLYKSENLGGLKKTGSPYDLAIIGDNQYFKVLTPRGERYSLNGRMIRNAENILVTSEGYPFVSVDGAVIEIPDEIQNIDVGENGMIYGNGEEIGRIGVFMIMDKKSLIKEGDSLYKNTDPDLPIEEYTIMSGYLRDSNVNSAKVMSDLIQAQRDFTVASDLIRDISDLEKNAISRFVK